MLARTSGAIGNSISSLFYEGRGVLRASMLQGTKRGRTLLRIQHLTGNKSTSGKACQSTGSSSQDIKAWPVSLRRASSKMQTESILCGAFPFHRAGVKPGDIATLHHEVKANFRLSAGNINAGTRRNHFVLTASGVFYCHTELSADLRFTFKIHVSVMSSSNQIHTLIVKILKMDFYLNIASFFFLFWK